MDVDEEFDVDETSGDDGIDEDSKLTLATGQLTERHKKLGFRPQKEIYCNRYLPYADQLDDESQQMLVDVKEFLAVAIAKREMVPAISTAVSRLIMWVVISFRLKTNFAYFFIGPNRWFQGYSNLCFYFALFWFLSNQMTSNYARNAMTRYIGIQYRILCKCRHTRTQTIVPLTL